jgi:hypothetical protein
MAEQASMPVRVVQVLVMDTEGFGAPGATVDTDAQVFALAVLMCSLLVYNRLGRGR